MITGRLCGAEDLYGLQGPARMQLLHHLGDPLLQHVPFPTYTDPPPLHFPSPNLQVTTHGSGGMDATWIMRFAQSAEDGAMPLLHCVAAPGVASGELYEPGGAMRMSGLPVKGQLESLCTEERAGKELWEASEEACGKWAI
jgi:hypothetical protein